MKANINLDLPFIRQCADRYGRLLTGRIDGLRLFTALQPIYSLAHKRIVGYEALLRAKNQDDSWLNPASLFAPCRTDAQQIHLDRLCRYIHINNFTCTDDPINWLFLNVSARTISNGKSFGSFFGDLIRSLDFPAHRIVIEVVEQPIDDNGLLMDAVNYYKKLGCLIAIDDFGAGHSNFDRIWTLQPDIVKLDRSFLVKASGRKNIRDMLPGIVSSLHQAGALVLLEGIETQEQVMMAIESDADFVQGFYFAKPFMKMSAPPEAFLDFDLLFQQYKALSGREKRASQEMVRVYDAVFSLVVKALQQGQCFSSACRPLLQKKEVNRCYQIGADGIQIGETVVSADHQASTDKRFRPLEDARSADWCRRHYLGRAILHPGQLQVTRPYLSITGAHMCVTLSMQFLAGGKDSVLCCDISV